ncbi:hypothetical protein Poli38472_002712 [Pythium oligandrum]|uniref:Endonuclease/exonuclease/phosphatase domain-containing protein n=1 Tax=Pythium oligandrum TaxID=41045 RepID=A0A8K1CHP5_PYTOL|nr:hypothetical protein Poli38472_002712 [Pythium oligandrum]|eukprot:TMW63771.1 hypothetical protein Poli38472_002712 [Pythium oligandrum]
MNNLEAFFPNSSLPQNPYRHAPYYPSANASTRRSGGGGNRKASTLSLQDKIFVVIGTLVCFLMFMAWKGVPGASSAGPIDATTRNGVVAVPRLKGGRAAEVVNSPPLNLKIMTFNLRFAGGNDGFNGWRFRKDHVADIINRYHPAIMGTQEGLKDQLAELKELLTHPYERYGVEREVDGEFEQIFYDTTIVEFLEGGNFWLSETPDKPHTKGWDAACVRLVTWCKFRLLATKQEFYFFNTQLDHVGATSRAQGSKLLWDRMQEITKTADAPLFLMGDFNTYRHTSTYSYFTRDADGPQLLEAWPEADEKIGTVSYTYHGWAGVDNDGERGAVVAANHIDWIFYRPQMKVLKTEVITEARNGRYPSDHYPIQAEVLFPSIADIPPSSY